jgi:tetratricopeptide (TPR) repeat protein
MTPPHGHPIVGTFAIVFAAIAGLWVFDSFLERMDRAETLAEAQRSFAEGRTMAAAGRNAEAVDRFSGAVAIARDNRDYQLALANALLAVGKTNEAEATANQALQRDSTDGPANLTMARINLQEGDFEDAESYYHRAIYGRWPSDPAQHPAIHRTEVRLELIDRLSRRDLTRPDARQELLAELLAVEGDVTDVATQKRLAHLYLAAGSPSHSAQLFQTIVRERHNDPDAYAGLGDADLAQRNYRRARTDFESALHYDRGDAAVRKRLDLTDEVLGLDPMILGLSAAERYGRSALLLKLADDALTRCAGQSPSKEISDLLGKSATALQGHVRRDRESDAMEANIDLALDLWKARGKVCGAVTEPEQPLALVLAEVNR